MVAGVKGVVGGGAGEGLLRYQLGVQGGDVVARTRGSVVGSARGRVVADGGGWSLLGRGGEGNPGI